MRRFSTLIAFAVLAGSAQADFNKGRGEVQDFAESANWYRKSAAQNNVDAQETLCSMYFFGQAGITQDYSEAIKYCAPAGKQGKPYPAYLGAYMFEFGKGTDSDLAQAATLYKVAAEADNVDAQEALGRMYFFGQGVAQDYADAAKWNRKAADQGRSFA